MLFSSVSLGVAPPTNGFHRMFNRKVTSTKTWSNVQLKNQQTVSEGCANPCHWRCLLLSPLSERTLLFSTPTKSVVRFCISCDCDSNFPFEYSSDKELFQYYLASLGVYVPCLYSYACHGPAYAHRAQRGSRLEIFFETKINSSITFVVSEL